MTATVPATGARPAYARWEVPVLLAAAALLFLANIGAPSLPALDDCYYARKGVELGRRGEFFTVTWNGQPTFQNPPLQFWILGRSFALLGENDRAARLPSAFMALGIALAVYRIGVMTLGTREAATALAFLLATPIFTNNARRAMLEIPLTFWVVLSVLVFVAGLERPRLHLLLALPLGAAILTKSVLGLLPLGVIAGAMADARARECLRRPWLWLGIGGGLLLGAAWPIQQALTLGAHAAREHFLGEVLGKSTQPIPAWRRVFGYPLLLLERYHPPVLPAMAGVALIWREWRREGNGRALVVVAWILLPLFVYGFSSAQTLRYIFPVLPALALAAGAWLARALPRVAGGFRAAVAILLMAGAVVFWVKPRLLTQPGNEVFKQQAAVVQGALAREEPIVYAGDRYWSLANPLLYYAERALEMPRADLPDAIREATARPSRLLMLDRSRLLELQELRVPHLTVLEGEDWALVRIRKGAKRALEGRPPL
jgi:4-amino-4-deoxy-L-arabinose transferase-like glycosyltransferase